MITSNIGPEMPVSGPKSGTVLFRTLLVLGALIVISVLVWQGLAAGGTPDPTAPDTSHVVATLDIGVLVFREGLECILVLSAITAGMVGANKPYRGPVAVGAGGGFLAALVTWFIAAAVMEDLSASIPA